MSKLKKPTSLYPFTNKQLCMDIYRRMLLNKTLNLFKYEGLPDSIPQRELERIIQVNGAATIAEKDGTYYALNGRLGDELNAYYLPTKSIIANPWIPFNETRVIGESCEVIWNNSSLTNLFEYADKYITQMVENDITQNLSNMMMRMMNIMVCQSDDAKSEADRYIKSLIDGKPSALVADHEFADAINTQPFSSASSNQVIQLIEYAQFLKGSLNNLFGFKDNLNLKREYVSDAELDTYNQPANEIVMDMLIQRQDGVERVNKLYDLNITVQLNTDLFAEDKQTAEQDPEEPEEVITEEKEVEEDERQ